VIMELAAAAPGPRCSVVDEVLSFTGGTSVLPAADFSAAPTAGAGYPGQTGPAWPGCVSVFASERKAGGGSLSRVTRPEQSQLCGHPAFRAACAGSGLHRSYVAEFRSR